MSFQLNVIIAFGPRAGLKLLTLRGATPRETTARQQQADARLAQVVEMRYFGGLSEAEIAEALGLSERTLRRDWEKARLPLIAAMA